MLCLCTSAQAKWLSRKDAQLEVLKKIQNHYVNADGTSNSIFEEVYLITSESARENLSIIDLNYNGFSQKFQLLHAYTEIDGKKYKPSEDKIENKELSSGGQGFDSFRSIKIPFPKLKIGAKVFLKYKIKTTVADFKNFYSKNFFFLNIMIIFYC